MNENQHIFLSYRSIEADFALKLAADLKNAGVNLWMDRLDGIHGGDDWRKQIEDALNSRQCASMISVISPEYLKASYCRNELARADRLNIPILPVLLYPVTDLPIEIERVQYVPFCKLNKDSRLESTWRDSALYDAALEDLLHTLPAAQKGAAPDPETQYLTSLIAELESRKGVLEYVELSAQTGTPGESDMLRPLQLEEWAAGFSMLVERPAMEMHSDSSSNHGTASERIHIDSVAEAVERYPRFVLIGDPGSGKTTVIRRLALNAAHKRLENPRTSPLPMLLYLPRWNRETTPLDFIRKNWPFENDPAGPLAQGDILLYLDGLNEMGANAVDKVRKLRDWLQQDDAPQRVIFTCRTNDYRSDLLLTDVPTVLAEELTITKIREFAGNYLAEKAPAFLERILPENGDEHDKHGLFQLSKNPYLLAALIFVYQQSPAGDLPRNNGILMQALTRALWDRERQKHMPGWIPFEEMERHVSGLAFRMLNRGLATDTTQRWVLQNLRIGSTFQDSPDSAEDFLKTLQDAHLIDIRDNTVRFSHQLIQEYFAAIELIHVGIESKIENLALILSTEDAQKTVSWVLSKVFKLVMGDTRSAFQLFRKLSFLFSLRSLFSLQQARQTMLEDERMYPILEWVSGYMLGLQWYEPIIMACGLVANPEEIINILVQRKHFLLVARCINLNESLEPLKEQVVQNLAAELHLKDNLWFLPAGAALIELDPATATSEFVALLNQEMDTRFNAGTSDIPESFLIVFEKFFGKTHQFHSLIDVLTYLGTPEALAAVEQWQTEQEQK